MCVYHVASRVRGARGAFGRRDSKSWRNKTPWCELVWLGAPRRVLTASAGGHIGGSVGWRVTRNRHQPLASRVRRRYTLSVCVSPNKYIYTTHKHQQIKLWDSAPLSFNFFSDVSKHVSDTKKLNTQTL
jgi:hypothetical protein